CGGLKKLLIDRYSFPASIKLLGRGLGIGGPLVTLKACEKLPEDGEIVLHGVDCLFPVPALPQAPVQRSREEQAWAHQGLIPRLTNEQALAMFEELRQGFACEAFQEQLRELCREK
ncbi:unnamed protein product, partial [Polarella glacialis]